MESVPLPAARALWLDALPEDVRIRIATYVSCASATPSALALARASPPQAAAVAAALSHTVVIDAAHTAAHLRALRVLLPHARHLRLALSAHEALNVAHAPLRPFLAAASLRSADVPAHPAVLAVLAAAPVPAVVARVSLLPHATVPAPVLAALHALAHDPRRSLTVSVKPLCTDRVRAPRAAPPWRCPHPRCVPQRCPCPADAHFQWCFLHDLPAAREMHMLWLPTSLVPTLPPLRAANVIGLDVAERLGPSVSSFLHLGVFDRHHLARLAVCPNITALAVALHPAADHLLDAIVDTFPALTSLQAVWQSHQQQNPLHPEPSALSELTPGTLLRAVRKAPALVSLSLRQLRLSREEIVAVLETMGDRLQRLTISVTGQEEHCYDRLEIVLRTAIRCNPSLLVFDVSPTFKLIAKDHLSHRTEQARQIAWLFERLKRRAPLLEWSHVKNVLNTMLFDATVP